MRHAYALKLHEQKRIGLVTKITDEQFLVKLWTAIKSIHFDYANQFRQLAGLPTETERCLSEEEKNVIVPLSVSQNPSEREKANALFEKVRQEVCEAIKSIKSNIPSDVIATVYDDETSLFDTDEDIFNIVEEQMAVFLTELPNLAIKYWKELISSNLHEKHILDNGTTISLAGLMILEDIVDPCSLVYHVNSNSQLAIALLKFPPFILKFMADQCSICGC